MTDLEILALLVKAKELGVTQAQVDSYKATKSIINVPDYAPEDILSPLPMSDMPTDEEILYYATPHYDEIQANKRTKEQAINEEVR
jgi:hypothetical protein